MNLESLDELVRTIVDAAAGASVVIAVNRDLVTELASVLPAHQIVPAEETGQADFVVLDDSIDQIGADSALRGALARVGPVGQVFCRFALDMFAGTEREAIHTELVERFPGHAFRLIGTVGADHAGLSPWVALQRALPRAWLFIGSPRAGKTNAVMDLAARTGMHTVHGDQLLEQLATGIRSASPSLTEYARLAKERNDWSLAIGGMFNADLHAEFVRLVLEDAQAADLLFEMWVPLEWRTSFAALFAEHGYFAFQAEPDAAAAFVTRSAELAAARDDLARLEIGAAALREDLARLQAQAQASQLDAAAMRAELERRNEEFAAWRATPVVRLASAFERLRRRTIGAPAR